VDGLYSATLQLLSTRLLSIWLKQQVSTDPETFYYNGHCVLLCPSLGSVPKLAFVHLKSVNTTFPAYG
jgi:hypothetical protein